MRNVGVRFQAKWVERQKIAMSVDARRGWSRKKKRYDSPLQPITIAGGCVLVRSPINFEEDCKVAGEQLKAAVSVQRAHSHPP